MVTNRPLFSFVLAFVLNFCILQPRKSQVDGIKFVLGNDGDLPPQSFNRSFWGPIVQFQRNYRGSWKVDTWNQTVRQFFVLPCWDHKDSFFCIPAIEDKVVVTFINCDLISPLQQVKIMTKFEARAAPFIELDSQIKQNLGNLSLEMKTTYPDDPHYMEHPGTFFDNAFPRIFPSVTDETISEYLTTNASCLDVAIQVEKNWKEALQLFSLNGSVFDLGDPGNFEEQFRKKTENLGNASGFVRYNESQVGRSITRLNKIRGEMLGHALFLEQIKMGNARLGYARGEVYGIRYFGRESKNMLDLDGLLKEKSNQPVFGFIYRDIGVIENKDKTLNQAACWFFDGLVPEKVYRFVINCNFHLENKYCRDLSENSEKLPIFHVLGFHKGQLVSKQFRPLADQGKSIEEAPANIYSLLGTDLVLPKAAKCL